MDDAGMYDRDANTGKADGVHYELRYELIPLGDSGLISLLGIGSMK